MLKYMPLYGSILLTVIIVWIIVSTIIGNRRKIRQAVSGLYVRSTCCGATSTPFGWTADGWVLTCDECGAWQYLGDDHDNPPPGFNADGTPISRRLPAPRPSAASGPADEGQFVSRPTRFTGKMPALGAPYGLEVTSDLGAEDMLALLRDGRKLRPVCWSGTELLGNGYCFVRDQHTFVEHTPSTIGVETSPAIAGVRDAIRKYGGAWLDVTDIVDGRICSCPADERPAICQHLYALSDCQESFLKTQAEFYRHSYREAHPEIAALWDTPEGRQAVSSAALSIAIAEPTMAERDAMFDEGEPLMLPPQPNIGGEGHPDYQGPHYNVEHDQFVPYDVLRDPLPGAAVHIVGNVACVGPIAVEPGDRGNATLDSSREDEE